MAPVARMAFLTHQSVRRALQGLVLQENAAV